MRVRRFLHILLFLIAGAMLWRILGTWRRPLDEQRPVAQANPSEDAPLAFPLTPQPSVGKQYAVTIADKDLFTSSRGRAPATTQPAAAAVPPPSHLKLVGVILSGDKNEALFADSSQGGKIVRAQKGEALGAYKLVGVAPLQVTLAMGQRGEEVSLPLTIVDSHTAGQAPQLMPQTAKGNPGAYSHLQVVRCRRRRLVAWLRLRR